jgi:hypothetical protein
LYVARDPQLETRFAAALNADKKWTRQSRKEEDQDQVLVQFARQTGSADRLAILNEVFASPYAIAHGSNYTRIHQLLLLTVTGAKPVTTREWASITLVTFVLLLVPAKLVPRALRLREKFVLLVTSNHTSNNRRPPSNDLPRPENLFCPPSKTKNKTEYVKKLVKAAVTRLDSSAEEASNAAESFLSGVETLVAWHANRNKKKLLEQTEKSDAFKALSERLQKALARDRYHYVLCNLIVQACKAAGLPTDSLKVQNPIVTRSVSVSGWMEVSDEHGNRTSAANTWIVTSANQMKAVRSLVGRSRFVDEMEQIVEKEEPSAVVAVLPPEWPFQQRKRFGKKKKGGAGGAKTAKTAKDGNEAAAENEQSSSDEEEEVDEGGRKFVWENDTPVEWTVPLVPTVAKIRAGARTNMLSSPRLWHS